MARVLAFGLLLGYVSLSVHTFSPIAAYPTEAALHEHARGQALAPVSWKRTALLMPQHSYCLWAGEGKAPELTLRGARGAAWCNCQGRRGQYEIPSL